MEDAASEAIVKFEEIILQKCICVLCIAVMIMYLITILYRVFFTTTVRNTDSAIYCPLLEIGEEIEEWKDIEYEGIDESVFDDICSPFERLPREIIFEIFDYVSESIHNLKLASRLLRYRIDDYVQEDRIPLVKELTYTETGRSRDSHISINVPRKISDLFEMRLKIRKTDQSCQAVQAYRYPKCFRRNHFRSQHLPFVYELSYKAATADRMLPLEKWLGKQLGKVTLFNCSGSILDSVIGQLAEFKFNNLEMSMPSLSKQDFDVLLNFIKVHHIVQLSLRVGRIDNFNNERALIDLSSHVRILYLGKRSDNDRNHLFNIDPTEWDRIGLEMFSRRLDTLYLNNCLNPLYIAPQCLATLLKELPRIGKKVLFQATGNTQNATDEESIHTQIDDECVMKFISNHGKWSVGVKHSSRLHECYSLNETEWDLQNWTVRRDRMKLRDPRHRFVSNVIRTLNQ